MLAERPISAIRLPDVLIDSSDAHGPVRTVVKNVMTFSDGDPNTVGTGARIQVLQTIGAESETSEEWVEVPHSNRVTARWIFSREVQKRKPKALNLCDIEEPKFDVMIEYHSLAAEHLRERARAVVDAYIENSRIVQNARDQSYVVGPIAINETRLAKFRHAIHEGYSDLAVA